MDSWLASVTARSPGRRPQRTNGVSYLSAPDYRFGEARRWPGQCPPLLRLPTLRDLYATDRGNPDLEAETTRLPTSARWSIARRHGADGGGRALQDPCRRFHRGVSPAGSRRISKRISIPGHRDLGKATADSSASALPRATRLDAENRSSGADTRRFRTDLASRSSPSGSDYELTPGMCPPRGGLQLHVYVADSYTLSRTTPTTTR